jgi:hypothetical protein
METLLDVVNVKAHPGYKLELEFENGEYRIFDMTPYVDEKPFNKLRGISKNPYLRASALRIACLPRFVTILRCSQKMFPYLSIIGCVNIFCTRLVLFKTLNF